jgi:hypothetical protein
MNNFKNKLELIHNKVYNNPNNNNLQIIECKKIINRLLNLLFHKHS